MKGPQLTMKLILCLFLFNLISSGWCDCEIRWVLNDNIDVLPQDAVLAAADNPAGEFYVARANVEGVVTPGRFNYPERQFFYTMDGKEYSLRADFEVLTNPNGCYLNWRKAFDGTLPRGSLEVGTDKDGVRIS